MNVCMGRGANNPLRPSTVTKDYPLCVRSWENIFRELGIVVFRQTSNNAEP